MQQELKMTLLPKQNCWDFLNQGYSVELCASGETEPCSAYNGSPLLYKYSDTYFLVYRLFLTRQHILIIRKVTFLNNLLYAPR